MNVRVTLAAAAVVLALGAFNAHADDDRKARNDARSLRAQAHYMWALSNMLSLQGPNTGAQDLDPGRSRRTDARCRRSG